MGALIKQMLVVIAITQTGALPAGPDFLPQGTESADGFESALAVTLPSMLPSSGHGDATRRDGLGQQPAVGAFDGEMISDGSIPVQTFNNDGDGFVFDQEALLKMNAGQNPFDDFSHSQFNDSPFQDSPTFVGGQFQGGQRRSETPFAATPNGNFPEEMIPRPTDEFEGVAMPPTVDFHAGLPIGMTEKFRDTAFEYDFAGMKVDPSTFAIPQVVSSSLA